MKQTSTIITAFLLFSAVLFYSCCGLSPDDEQDTQEMNQQESSQDIDSEIPDALTVIHQRKSVRSYTDEDVSIEQLETLLKAGMAAPTAGNRQPWHFVVIDDREKLAYLTNYLPYGQMLNHAAAAIIVCGDLSKVNIDGPEYWVQDCSAATQNILLAAEAIGLGAVWIGIYPAEQRTKDMINALELDEIYIPLSAISIGYPEGDPQPKDKWNPDKIDWVTR